MSTTFKTVSFLLGCKEPLCPLLKLLVYILPPSLTSHPTNYSSPSKPNKYLPYITKWPPKFFFPLLHWACPFPRRQRLLISPRSFCPSVASSARALPSTKPQNQASNPCPRAGATSAPSPRVLLSMLLLRRILSPRYSTSSSECWTRR